MFDLFLTIIEGEELLPKSVVSPNVETKPFISQLESYPCHLFEQNAQLRFRCAWEKVRNAQAQVYRSSHLSEIVSLYPAVWRI